MSQRSAMEYSFPKAVLSALVLLLGGGASALSLVLILDRDWRSLAKVTAPECISERSPEHKAGWDFDVTCPWYKLWLMSLWFCLPPVALQSLPYSLKNLFWMPAGKKWSGENGLTIGLFTSSPPMSTVPQEKPSRLLITLSVRESLAPWKVSLPSTWGPLPCSSLARGWRKGWYHWTLNTQE